MGKIHHKKENKIMEALQMLRKPYTVAIVDDEEDVREVFSDTCEDYFSPEVIKVKSFESAADALMYIKEKNDVHIMTLDLNMDADNGEMLIPAFLKEAPHLKIVIVSGSEKLIPKWLCFSKGASKYLAKPFDKDEFISTIEGYIGDLEHWHDVISNN